MPESILCPSPRNAISDRRRHDPVGFWVQLRGDRDRFAQVEVLPQRNKPAVYRLLDCIHWAAQAAALSFLTVHQPRMAQALQALR